MDSVTFCTYNALGSEEDLSPNHSKEAWMAIWIMNFPLPPSVNEYLVPIRGRLVKSQVHRRYQTTCFQWASVNRQALNGIVASITRGLADIESREGRVGLRVDCWFAFSEDRLFTKTDKAKSIDANNRLKPLLDGLVQVTGIDDCLFFAGNCEKVVTTSKETECTVLKIEPMRPRSLDQIRQMMRQETSTAGS